MTRRPPPSRTARPFAPRLRLSPTPAIEARRLVKRFGATTAVDAISFAVEAGNGRRPARRQRRRQDDDDRHDHGADPAERRRGPRARRRHGARPLPRARPDEFREPLRRHAAPPHGAAESARVRPPLRRRRPREAHRGAGRGPGARAVSRPAVRQPFGRPEDPRRLGQGADQRSRAAAARRADRLARSRHRRLGAQPAGGVPPRARRDDPARLAQHGRGRAAVRPGDDAEAGPDRRRRLARRH